MSKQKIRVAIAGMGVVGKKRREFIEKNLNFDLVGICDVRFKRDLNKDKNIKIFFDYRAMLDQLELDAIFVCVTNDIAPLVVTESLKKGLDVFCEKPPGRDVNDIEKIISIEKSSKNLKLMYGFNHRFHDSVRKAKSIIESGELGKIINLNGVYGKSKIITFNQDDWRKQRSISGGGVLLDQGIHMVDLMRFFAGEYEDIYSFVSNSFWKYDVEDNAYALMKTKSGIVSVLHSSATSWRHRFSLSIALEKGGLILTGILSGSKSYGSETLTVIKSDPENDNGDPSETIYSYNHDPSWEDEVNEFADCIIHNKKVIHGSSNDALQTMKTVYKIYCSDAEWKKKYNLTI